MYTHLALIWLMALEGGGVTGASLNPRKPLKMSPFLPGSAVVGFLGGGAVLPSQPNMGFSVTPLLGSCRLICNGGNTPPHQQPSQRQSTSTGEKMM